MKRMRELLLKLHMYAGLLTVSHLGVYAIAGLSETLKTNEQPASSTAIRYVPFAPDSSATDKDVADAVYRRLNIPLSTPLPEAALRRDASGNLLLDFYTPNGLDQVTVLEKERRLRIETTSTSWTSFLNNAHTAILIDSPGPPLVRAWAIWNEFAMWSLAGFSLTGLILWLTRPELPWALASLAVGIGTFVLFYFLLR
jgi:hypothetical protein